MRRLPTWLLIALLGVVALAATVDALRLKDSAGSPETMRADPSDAEAASDEQTTRGCPRADWPGPWTRCSEARWVGRVVEAGGYSVGDGRGTGSALTAKGRARGFFVWAAATGAVDRPPAEDGVRTSWSAQGYTFWVQAGPEVAAVKPTIEELDPVVAASRRLPPPPADD